MSLVSFRIPHFFHKMHSDLEINFGHFLPMKVIYTDVYVFIHWLAHLKDVRMNRCKESLVNSVRSIGPILFLSGRSGKVFTNINWQLQDSPAAWSMWSVNHTTFFRVLLLLGIIALVELVIILSGDWFASHKQAKMGYIILWGICYRVTSCY